jgi:uncharacterized damage-inducible protein DinB
MESLDLLRRLFDYDYWGIQEALRSVETASGPRERVLKIAGHIIGAQRVWLARLEGPGASSEVPWPSLTLDEARTAAEDLHRRWSDFLSGLTQEKLGSDLVYRNGKGLEFHTPLRDVLVQLIVHGAYHRGQIAAVVRDAGGTPAATDYIVYVRQLSKSF